MDITVGIVMLYMAYGSNAKILVDRFKVKVSTIHKYVDR